MPWTWQIGDSLFEFCIHVRALQNTSNCRVSGMYISIETWLLNKYPLIDMHDCRQGETKSVWYSSISDLSTVYKQHGVYIQHVHRHIEAFNFKIFHNNFNNETENTQVNQSKHWKHIKLKNFELKLRNILS